MMDYDMTVKGSHVPEHFSITMSPQAARAVRGVIKEFRESCRREPGWFGLREDEDEALEALIDALRPSGGDDEDALVS